MNILVTGGTEFVSRYTAEYFSKKGHNIFVLNRGTKPQSNNVTLIKCDKYNIGNTLKNYNFDVVLDTSTYNEIEISNLINALKEIKQYIFVSSSAVYPETNIQPFSESQSCGENKLWGAYGTNKIAAENYLIENVPQAYIIRPPYLYGKMNNLYREAFIFDCAENNRVFYVPKDGNMPLHFFDIEDLCKFMEMLIEKQPKQKIFNVGNKDIITIKEWVELCYDVLNKRPELKFVDCDINQREYFPFLDYSYKLDVTEMLKLFSNTKPIQQGLKESYDWYKHNKDKVRVKPLIEFIDNNLK